MAAESLASNPGHETSNSNAGNATNCSQNPSRRSNRSSSAVVAPNMVTPSSDSRVQLSRPVKESKKRRASSHQASSDNDSIQNQSISSVRSAKQKNKKQGRQTLSTSANTSKNRKNSKKAKKSHQAHGTEKVCSVHYHTS
jgi:hypothetical protein